MRRHSRFRSAVIAAWWALLTAAFSLAAVAQSAPTARGVILVVGDSLSAEYGLARGTGWVQLMSDRLRQDGGDYTVVNASISGETTSGGRTRLPSLLRIHRPSIVVLQLGANDGLRGLPINSMVDNLSAMIAASQAAGARVILVGIKVPPNYGREYSERFDAAYDALSKKHRVPLVPFLLEGFAESTDFFQADRIHPTAQAQPRMLENVWPAMKPLLKRQ